MEIDCADLIVAHNAAFDRKWFGIGPLPIINKPWICSMDDIAWPEEKILKWKEKRLIYFALRIKY